VPKRADQLRACCVAGSMLKSGVMVKTSEQPFYHAELVGASNTHL
jgi:hypothetical protein